MESDPVTYHRLTAPTLVNQIARLSALAAVLTGTLVLAGWVFDVAALRSVWPGLVEMKTNTALGLLLSGVALWLLSDGEAVPLRQTLARTCGATVFFIGSLTLCQYLFGWNLGIDQLLSQESVGALGTLAPNRMAPTSALNFVLIGLSLLLLDSPPRRGVFVSQVLTLSAALLTLPALVGYLYGVTTFFGIAQFTQMALHSTLAFLILCVGLLCARPRLGITEVLTSPDSAGVIARRLLPVMVLVPLAIGGLRIWGETANFFDSHFGTALQTVVNIVLYSALIWSAVKWLHRVDAERETAQQSLRRARDELEARVRERTVELEKANAALQSEGAERRRALEVLRESEERYHSVTQATNDAVLVADSDGNIVSWNNGARLIFGYDEAEMMGRSLTLLMPAGFREAHRSGIERMRAGGERRISSMVEVVGRRKDGSEFPLELSLGVWQTSRGSFFSGIMRDITERKQVEEERRIYAVRLERSNSELQNFASIASHDLQEPLRKVRAFGDRLQDECGESLSEDGRYYLERMQDAAGRMSTLINDLLAFSRITTKALPFVPVDLNQIAREVVSDLEIAIEESGARVEVGDLPTIEADALQMRQLMQNLLGNALKFRRPDETPVVEISSELLDGDNFSLTVKDNGIGFDPKYLDRIFNIFQRLHGRKDYEGSGIGLSICRKIAERHGGDISAYSAPGQGAAFVVTLPLRYSQGDIL